MTNPDQMAQADLMARPRPTPTHPDQRWCGEHWRYECSKGSKRRQGGNCHASAVRGTPACFTHAGKRRDIAKAQGEAITAWSALAGEATITSKKAVMGMLQMTWLRVHLYADLLRQQVEAAQAERGDGSTAGGMGPGVGAGAGLVGQTFGASPSVGIYATGEAPRSLSTQEAAERDRVVRYAKTAHDMGIAEDQIRIAESQGAMLAAVFARFARLVGRDPADQEVQRLMQLAISEEIGAGVIEGRVA